MSNLNHTVECECPLCTGGLGQGSTIKIRPVPNFEVNETNNRLDLEPIEVNNTTGVRKFLYWYQELDSSFVVIYGTFLSHEEAVEVFKGKYKYGLVSPKLSHEAP